DLDRARGTPHQDEAVDPLARGGVRDGLRMVAGRPRDDAAPALLGRQRGQPVQGAARLERARALEELRFQVDARAAEALAERARAEGGRTVDAAVDRLPRPEHVVERERCGYARGPGPVGSVR